MDFPIAMEIPAKYYNRLNDLNSVTLYLWRVGRLIECVESWLVRVIWLRGYLSYCNRYRLNKTDN